MLDIEKIKSKLLDFNEIYFEIKYPSLKYVLVYQNLLKMKRKHQSFIKIAIFINCTIIEDSRFYHSQDINFIRFGPNTTMIHQGFRQCSSLVGVEIPSSVTRIESFAFLKYITCLY